MTLAAERLLVVGASGLVGGELAQAAEAAGHRVLGVARRVRGKASRSVDLEQKVQVEAVLTEFNPTLIALCSAYPHVDGCEQDPERSWRENVATVANVVQAAQGSDAKILFFSTDQVFDGSRPSFVESDAVHPLNVYARHKREAEQLLVRRGSSLVVRSAWIFGQELQKKNFMYQVLSAARRGETLRLPVGQAGCPTWAGWLARTTLELLASGMDGVVHLAGSELLTKAEWAGMLCSTLKLPCDVVEVGWREAGQVAPRPERVVLKSERHSQVQPPLMSILETQREQFTRS